MIFGAITSLLGNVVEGYFETKKAKAKQKLVKIEAETAIMKKQISGEIDWDIQAQKNAESSWKDEWLTIIFTIPLIMLMLGQEERVNAFFAALENAPDFYQYLLGVIVAASFGFRGASKFLGKK